MRACFFFHLNTKLPSKCPVKEKRDAFEINSHLFYSNWHIWIFYLGDQYHKAKISFSFFSKRLQCLGIWDHLWSFCILFQHNPKEFLHKHEDKSSCFSLLSNFQRLAFHLLEKENFKKVFTLYHTPHSTNFALVFF